MKTIIVLLTVATAAFAQDAAIDYRFDAVRRKVTLTSGDQAQLVERGARARGGDRVETGWFSYALIASDRYRARFEIFSSTDVRLAENEPGVILSLERGRLHAIFDKIIGSEPRIVKTPGALLAVRGTEFEVEVDGTGRTTVDVFEGIVEVRSAFRPEPLLLHPGERSTFGRRERPEARSTPEGRHHGPMRGGEPHGPGTDRPSPMPGHMPPSGQPKPGHHP